MARISSTVTAMQLSLFKKNRSKYCCILYRKCSGFLETSRTIVKKSVGRIENKNKNNTKTVCRFFEDRMWLKANYSINKCAK